MDLFLVKGRLTGPAGRVEDVELLVDTGATLSVADRPASPLQYFVHIDCSAPIQVAEVYTVADQTTCIDKLRLVVDHRQSTVCGQSGNLCHAADHSGSG